MKKGNPYIGAGNPYLNPENPYEEERKEKIGRQLFPLGLQLLKMKSIGTLKVPEWRFGETTPGEVLAVEGKPTVAIEEVPTPAEQAAEAAETAAEEAATEATGAEGLDAFTLGEEAAAEEAGTLVDTATEGLSAFDLTAGAEGLTEGLSAFDLTPLAEAGGVSAGMGGAGEAASGFTAGMGGAGETGAAGTVGSLGLSAYTGPVMAGYELPKIIDILHKDSMENLGKNVTIGTVRHEKTAKTVGSGVAGAAAGALAGAAATSWSGPGAIVGALIGAGAGALGVECIIISACTSPDSYEVEIARKYRDRYMTLVELTGYYALCPHVVPLIHKYPLFKKIIKRMLVDRLVDYGEWKLGMKERMKYRTSGAVKTMFLGLCRLIGWVVGTALQEG